jgi:hypothetical protein
MLPQRPAWLDDEPEIQRWFDEAIDRLDMQSATQRSRPLQFPVTEKRFPGLFLHGPEADARWELIKSLTKVLPLAVVPKRKTNPFATEYEGARLDLGTECEAVLREWLKRPSNDPEMQAWQQAVENAEADWPADARMRLRTRPIRIRGREPGEVVSALVHLGRLRCQRLTLRQMSARAFFGDSKFLEGREALFKTLYPGLFVEPRPILVAVTLPRDVRGVLFIENHDTYVRAAGEDYPQTAGLALVYAAGFKGTAARIRDPNGAVLHYGRAETDLSDFSRWFTREVERNWPVFFWGDLDFEGMRILKGFHDQFGAMAWRPGYEALLALLNEGGAHVPEAADKSNQKLPEPTGCPYADKVLIPALMSGRRFVDQEAW